MIFIKLRELQIILRAKQTLDVLIALQEKVLSYVRSETHHSIWAFKKSYSDLKQSHKFRKNEQMQMVFTTEEFLEVATENWPKWDLNP